MFLSSEQRLALNNIEPFDEWEEFALFASHYFLVVAVKSPGDSLESSQNYVSKAELVAVQHSPSLAEQFVGETIRLTLEMEILPKGQGQRRFGAAYQISPGIVGHHGGFGTQSRLESTDIYKLEHCTYNELSSSSLSIEARMCHTTTNLRGTETLLVGGRTSPNRALADCWLRHKGVWRRVEDLPIPLYRHCAASVELGDGDQGVLIYGGKSNAGRISGDWFLWRSQDKWENLKISGHNIEPRFGVVIASTTPKQGILLGGMAEDGTICNETLEWRISNIDTKPCIKLRKRENYATSLSGLSNSVHRLGACLTWSSAGLLLIGGVSRDFVSQELDVIRLFPGPSSTGDCTFTNLEPSFVTFEVHGPRPLLVGHSVYACQNTVALAGGGAVCFSFGTYWNKHVCTFQTGDRGANLVWRYDRNLNQSSDAPRMKESSDALTSSTVSWNPTDTAMSVVPRMTLEDSRHFERIVQISNPVVMDDMDLGPCVTEWSLEALKVKVGAQRPVSALW